MNIKMKEITKKKEKKAVELTRGIYHATFFNGDRILIVTRFADLIHVIDNDGNTQQINKKYAYETYKNIRKIKNLKIQYEV